MMGCSRGMLSTTLRALVEVQHTSVRAFTPTEVLTYDIFSQRYGFFLKYFLVLQNNLTISYIKVAFYIQIAIFHNKIASIYY